MKSPDPDSGPHSGGGVPAVTESARVIVQLIQGIDVSELDDGAVLDVLKDSERIIAAAQALQAHALTRFAQHRPPGGEGDEFDNAAVDEIAAELRWSVRQAGGRLWHAWRISHRTPAVLAGLSGGVLDQTKALVLDHETRCLTDEQARSVVDRVLAKAGDQTSAQLTRRVRRAVIQADPRAAEQRHARARAERSVNLVPDDDGMAELIGRLPADVATRAYARIDQLAKHTTSTEDPRSIDAVRADVFADLLLGNPTPLVAPGRIEVRVTVGADVLLGMSDEPGELGGYGPVPAGLARRLAHDPHATWRRLLTDPEDGTLLDYGRRTYRPPAGLADHVRARDARCTFPACSRSAGDLDHTVPYPAGPTSADNLRLTCRRHHRLKQRKGWSVRQLGGRVTWTTPTGRTHVRHPEPPLRPPEPLPDPTTRPDHTDPDPPPF